MAIVSLDVTPILPRQDVMDRSIFFMLPARVVDAKLT
jgi:hypothetical protein